MPALAALLHPNGWADDGIVGHGRSATAFETEPTATGQDDKCDWHEMQLGNNTGIWKPEKAEIKYQYDYNLKGQEIHVFWPGKTASGQCNDLLADKRGCWYRARMLNDVGCRSEDRCLHFAAHDGEARHTFTCPTWVRRSDGTSCVLPIENGRTWQACPIKFNLKRVDSGVPQDFKKAMLTQCPVEPKVAKPKTGGATGAEDDGEKKPGGDEVAGKGKNGEDTKKAEKPRDEEKNGGKDETKKETGAAGDAASNDEKEGKKDNNGATLENARKGELEALEHPESMQKMEKQVAEGEDKETKEQNEMVDKFIAEHTTHIKKDHCVGSTADDKEANMIFDIKHNSWFRCTSKFRCEPWDIREIPDFRMTKTHKCGDKLSCKDDEQCFVHRVTSKQSTHECVRDDRVFMISEGDDVAKFCAPLPLVTFQLPARQTLERKARTQRRELHIRQFL